MVSFLRNHVLFLYHTYGGVNEMTVKNRLCKFQNQCSLSVVFVLMSKRSNVEMTGSKFRSARACEKRKQYAKDVRETQNPNFCLDVLEFMSKPTKCQMDCSLSMF